MPFETNKDLPNAVRRVLPDNKAQAIFREAFNNNVYRQDVSEADAFKIAWGAVSNAGYEKGEDGMYRLKKQESFEPPKAVQQAASRGLEMRSEFGRGGTEVGIARARDLSNGTAVSLETINRMVSYFARHEVDRQAEGFTRGEKGYPSNGKIAWELWGGDAGRTWAESIASRVDKSEKVIDLSIVRKQEVERLVYCVVAEPETVDTDGELYSAEEIKKAAHIFQVSSRTVGLQHLKKADDVVIVESFITLSEMDFAGHGRVDSDSLDKSTVVKEGSWIVVLKVCNDDIWDDVLSGEFQGISMGGRARRVPLDEAA